MLFNNVSYQNLIGLSSSLSLLISENLSSEEISVLGAFFTTLGDNLSLISTQKALLNTQILSDNNNNNNIQ